jgi:phosphoglycolate phosphatase-like HAD superfamily hydrolase
VATAVRLILEFDGPVFDVAPLYYDLHRAIATELGWSHLDRGTYWRITRKHGHAANVLRGARPVKLEAYHARFSERLETDGSLLAYVPHADIARTLIALQSLGLCHLITAGSNLPARTRVLGRYELSDLFSEVVGLDADPRRRPGELRTLAGSDPRTVVAAASGAIIRAAGAADILAVGIACGASSESRLYQAGAALVYRDLHGLARSLDSGAEDLIRAGLLPGAAC